MCLWSRHLWLTPLSDQRPRPAAQDTRCEGRLMVSNVTSHDNIPVISMICKQWELITPSQISPCSLFWPPVSPVSAPQQSDINFFFQGVRPHRKNILFQNIFQRSWDKTVAVCLGNVGEWLTIEKCVERWKTILDLIGLEPIWCGMSTL